MNPERYLLVMGAERSPALLSRAGAQLPDSAFNAGTSARALPCLQHQALASWSIRHWW
jgi:hypothetical protein